MAVQDSSQAATHSGSILAVDFGNVHTRAVLIDVVEGVYRLVAQSETGTTASFPAGDIGVGLRRALDHLTRITGRRFLQQDGRILSPEQPDRSGVDNFVATASIGHPLRTVLIGLAPDVSIASGFRAVAGTYVQVVETLTANDNRGEETLVNAIVLSRPDLIFITGGMEGGARDPLLRMARITRLALRLMTSQRKPPVLYAGNSALVPDIRALFEGMTTLFIAPNIRPTLDDEELETARLHLALAFDASSAQRGAGFEAVGSMSRLGILPTAQSYNLLVHYLGRALGADVLAVDMGSGVSTLSASHHRRTATSIRTDIGLGHSARTLVDAVGVEALRLWIPFFVTREELETYALNKTLRPSGVPETIREMYLEYALLRAGLRAMVQTASPSWNPALGEGKEAQLPAFGHIIGAGAALTETGRPGLTAMLLLDALAPVGAATLYTDPAALVPALGALAHVNPAAVVQVLDSGGLERLGVAFSLSGHPRTGRTAMRVKITPLDGAPAIKHEINGGELWIYPLPAGARAKVEVRAVGSGVTIEGKGRLRLETEGGAAGLIFDARGRPLPLTLDVRVRAAQMTAWHAQATGDAIHPIDEKWLQPLAEAAPAPATTRARQEQAARAKPKAEKPPKNGKQRGKQPEPEAQQESGEIDELRDLFS